MNDKTSTQRKARGPKKRDLIVDEASMILNCQGLGNTRLIDVAREVGLTRAALYYYFPDMQALAIACYERTIQAIRDSVEEAAATEGDGRTKLKAFFHAMMRAELLRRIAVVELEAIKGPQAEELSRELIGSIDGLIGLMREGFQDGSLKPATLPLVASAVMGAIGQCALDYQVGHGHSVDDWGEKLFDLFDRGLAKDQFALPELSRLPPLTGSTADIGFNRQALAEMRRNTLLRTATDMFNRAGVDAVTLDDIVERLSVTKGVFYHYMGSKEELLLACYERSLNLVEWLGRHIDELPISPIEKIGEFMRQVVLHHNGPEGPFVVFYGTHALSETRRAKVYHRLRLSEATKRKWLVEARADGSMRFADIDLAHQAIDGMLRWIPKWQIPEGDEGRYARAGDKLARLILFGMSREDIS